MQLKGGKALKNNPVVFIAFDWVVGDETFT